MAPTASSSSISSTALSTSHPCSSLRKSRVTVRSYLPTDQAAVEELFADGMRSYTHHDALSQQGLERYIRRALQQDLADIEAAYFQCGGHFWVATVMDDQEDEEIVVGMVALENKGDRRGELRRLSVHRKHRRQGVARLLVAALEQWATVAGFEAVELNTGDTMAAACSLYPALGYSKVRSQTICVCPRYVALFFEKRLTDAVS
ncbi:hypothetical protein PINS_up013666 [Pythium insidiosum]|nr:hypothetical protein PINS_up013666 [Pythium insidiosum]